MRSPTWLFTNSSISEHPNAVFLFPSSFHGTIFSYNKQFDGVNTRTEKPLEVKDMLRYNTTTSDDPIITEVSFLDTSLRLLLVVDTVKRFYSSPKRKKLRSLQPMLSCPC